MLGFVAKAAFGTIKFGVKHVIIPIAISAATAAVASAMAEKIREATPQDGPAPEIVPGP